MNPAAVIVLMLCLGSDPDECMQLNLRKSVPLTMEQCEAELPMVKATVATQLPPDVFITSAKCTNERDS